MELKKNPKVDLENKKSYFMEIGLVIVLAFTWLAFEYSSSPKVKGALNINNGDAIEDVIIPITRPEVKPVTPPPPSAPSEMLELVSDEINLDVDFSINVDADENTEINVIEFNTNDNADAARDEVIDEVEIHVTVENMPKFQGSEDINGKFRAWVSNNLKYPPIAKENGVTGLVMMIFVVDKTGAVVNPQILRSSGDKSIDEEAKRVVTSSPKWTPGMQSGKPANVQFQFQIRFALN